MNSLGLLQQKTAVRFAKTGPAIYHSHHDMIRFWERAVKRAELPMRLTQGFNPRPRIIFPHALGLGITSRHEEVELELHSTMQKAELVDRVRMAAGDTLDILDAVNLPPVKKSRQLQASSYRIAGWIADADAKMPRIVEEVLASPEILVRRGAPGNERTLDIRPYVSSLAWDDGDRVLLLELAHTQTGSARPDEIAKIAAHSLGMDAHGITIEKTAMRLV